MHVQSAQSRACLTARQGLSHSNLLQLRCLESTQLVLCICFAVLQHSILYIGSGQAGACGRAAGVKGVKEIDGKACVQLMATADRGSMLICGLQLAAGILERPQAQFLGTLVAEADGLQVN